MCQIENKLIVIDATEVVQHPSVKVTIKAPVNAPLNIQSEKFVQQATTAEGNSKTQIGVTSIQSSIRGKEIAGKVFNVLNLASNIG